MLRQLVKVVVTVDRDEKEIQEYKVEQLRFKPRKKKEKVHVQDDELKSWKLWRRGTGSLRLGKGENIMDKTATLNQISLTVGIPFAITLPKVPDTENAIGQ